MAGITGRTVLIVGASSGIGAEVARQLAHGANRFVITARRAPELPSVAEEIRAAGRVCPDIPADALNAQAAADVVAAAVAEYSSVDVVLLDAGQGPDMYMDGVSVPTGARPPRTRVSRARGVPPRRPLPYTAAMPSMPDSAKAGSPVTVVTLVSSPARPTRKPSTVPEVAFWT